MVANEHEKINKPGRLAFAGPKRVQLTSEQQFTARFGIGPEKDATVPEGYPVAWLEIGAHLKPVGIDAANRLVRHIGGKECARGTHLRHNEPGTDVGGGRAAAGADRGADRR